jgi:hypothetical protein
VHKEGHCLFGGDYLVLETGQYKVTFKMAIDVYCFATGPLVVLDVYENRTKAVLAEQQINFDGVTGRWQAFSIEFFAKEGQCVEFRVYWAGECFLIVEGVVLQKREENN